MDDVGAPDRKKLKPTYNPSSASAPLPSPWTEHTAPTGHKYYYNPQTKQSTYTRPAPPPPPPLLAPAFPHLPPPPFPAAHALPYSHTAPHSHTPPYSHTPPPNATPAPSSYSSASASVPYHFQSSANPVFNHHARPPYSQHRRPPPDDRPKRKVVIPNCHPWILVYTRLRRRFVHNLTTRESFWKFPPDVMKAVVEFDRLQLEKKLHTGDDATGANHVPLGHNPRARKRSASLQREDETALAAALADDAAETPDKPDHRPHDPATTPAAAAAAQEQQESKDSSEYEEIEVTDDEDEDAQHQDHPTPTTHQQHHDPPEQPVEFGEDDIAFQLAQMNDQYGLDPGEYDDGQEEYYQEGDQGLPLTHEDSVALFRDMLSDHAISPYTPWDNLISESSPLLSDPRYTVLSSTKARKEVWDLWSRDRVAELKAEREAQHKLRQKTMPQDPKIPYLHFLSTHATPKLYWPEFKRKYKRDPVMASSSSALTDKDREKLYRDYISRLKMSTSALKSDLVALLKTIPLSDLNRDTLLLLPDDNSETNPLPEKLLSSLPEKLLSSLPFYSLPPPIRDPLLKAHISTLPPAPQDPASCSPTTTTATTEKAQKERERREAALRARQQKVQEEKRRSEKELRIGRERLREGERELEMAMKVRGGGGGGGAVTIRE